MAVTYSDALATAMLQSGYQGQFVAGDIFEFRSGTQPATPNTVPTGTLLASATLGATPFGTASARAVVLATQTFTGQSGAGTGTAITWARLKKAADLGTAITTDKRQDFSVTVTGGGGDITLNNVNVSNTQTGTFTFSETL